MEIATKVHDSPNGKVIAACDKKLLGKEFSDEKRHIKAKESFYSENHVTKDELVVMLESCENANLLGDLAVSAYCKCFPAAKENVVRINGVAHLQVYSID